jgi:hypothetical protein
MWLSKRILKAVFLLFFLPMLFLVPDSLLGQTDCPQIIFGEPGTSSINCDTDSTALVTVNVTVKNTTSRFLHTKLEFGSDATVIVPSGTVGGTPSSDWTLTATCRYPTPVSTEFSVIIMDVDFEEIIKCSPVVFPLDVRCPENCPIIQSISIDIPACDDNESAGGNRIVTLDAAINNQGNANGIYQWNFGDGSTPVDIPFNAPNAPRTTHTYVCPNTGDYYVTLTIIGCTTEEFYSNTKVETIQFPSCGCPDIEDIVEEIDGCDAAFDASISSSCLDAVTGYAWNFGDGTTATNLSSDPTPTHVEHTYDSNGTYNVTLTLEGVGSGCSFTKEIVITGCGGGGGDDDDDDCFFCFCSNIGCCILWVLFIIAVIGMLSTLARLLCGIGSWELFLIFLAAMIALGALLIFVCDMNICALLTTMAASGFASFALICGTSIIIPQTCKTWLCQMTTIPGIGGITNLLLIDVIFTIIVAIVCLLI